MLEMNLIGSRNQKLGVNTAMLLHLEGLNGTSVFKDDANSKRVLQTNGPVISTAKAQFGASSLYMPGSGRVWAPDAPELRLHAEWTVEFWFNMTAVLGDTWLFAKNVIGYKNCLKTWNGNLYLQTENASAAIGTSGMIVGKWQHYAVVNTAGRTMLFMDGKKVMDFADTGSFGENEAVFAIGASSFEATSSNGYYDEFRVSKIPRYTADFTPPTAPFKVD